VKPTNPGNGLEYRSPEKAQTALDVLNRPLLQFLCNTALKESIPTIEEKLKYPSFTRFYPKFEEKYKKEKPKFSQGSEKYIYFQKPPPLKLILESNETNEKKSNIGLSATKNKNKTLDFYSMISPFKGTTQKDRIQELDKKLRQVNCFEKY